MALFERGSVNLARTLSSLRHRDFRLLFLGTSLSHVGDFIQVMAQSWLVWTMTSSPFLLGVVGFCQALPRLLLGAIGGAIVDRVERRRLLVSTQILAMLQAFVFWALVYFESIQFWHVIALVLFLGTVNSVNQTARYSLINNLVPRDDLMNAIALNSSMANLVKILGPSFGRRVDYHWRRRLSLRQRGELSRDHRHPGDHEISIVELKNRGRSTILGRSL
jgi:MFS family permease